MRLPAFLSFTGGNGIIQIYPEIASRQSATESDILTILLNTERNCQAKYCSLGAISTFRNYSVQSQNIINSAGDSQYRRTAPIT